MLSISSALPPVTTNPELLAEGAASLASWNAFARRDTPIQAAEAIAGEDLTLTIDPAWLRACADGLNGEDKTLVAQALAAFEGEIALGDGAGMHRGASGGNFELPVDHRSDARKLIYFYRRHADIDATAASVAYITIEDAKGNAIVRLGAPALNDLHEHELDGILNRIEFRDSMRLTHACGRLRQVIRSDPGFQKGTVRAFHALVAACQKHPSSWENFYVCARHLGAERRTKLLVSAMRLDCLLERRAPDDTDAEKLRVLVQNLDPQQLRLIACQIDARKQESAERQETAEKLKSLPGRKALSLLGRKKPPPEQRQNAESWITMCGQIVDNALALCKKSIVSAPRPQPEANIILDRFYACAAYMDNEEKTKTMCDVMALSFRELLPSPSKIDVEKFRSIAIDFNQDQRQSLRDWLSKHNAETLVGQAVKYRALLCQIFDTFPILKLGPFTAGIVINTEGQTFFTPELLETLQKNPLDRH